MHSVFRILDPLDLDLMTLAQLQVINRHCPRGGVGDKPTNLMKYVSDGR